METLIPDSLFESMESNLALFAIFLASMLGLVKGGDWLVEHAVHLARRLGVGTTIIGATVVSLGTTTPETAVSVMAAWEGLPDLALGNGIGSIICDTALVFGLCCLLTRLPADRSVLSRQGWLQFAAGALLTAICFGLRWWHPDDPQIGRGIGLFFLTLLALYLWLSVRWARGRRVEHATQAEEVPEAGRSAPVHFLWFGIGLLIVLICSRFLIGSVSELALRWEVPKSVIAATLVAFGTSLPELTTGIVAIRRGHPELLVGNVIGADILNVLFVIGASATAASLRVEEMFYWIHLPVMMAALILFRIFIALSPNGFSRWMGAPLLLLYVAYILIQYAAT